MKDKFAREAIEVLEEQTQRDYYVHIQSYRSLLQAHERLLQYLGLELKRTPETVTYVKRKKKNG